MASDTGSCIVNAICVPDGDHANAFTPSSVLVRRSASPPRSAIRYSCRLPSRSETNASQAPSGDHAGCMLDLRALVTWRDCPVAASPTQISVS